METTSTINSLVLLVQQSFNHYLPTQEELANRTMFVAKGLGVEHNEELIKLIETKVPFQMNIEGLK